jgi:hypothetical protein
MLDVLQEVPSHSDFPARPLPCWKTVPLGKTSL